MKKEEPRWKKPNWDKPQICILMYLILLPLAFCIYLVAGTIAIIRVSFLAVRDACTPFKEQMPAKEYNKKIMKYFSFFMILKEKPKKDICPECGKPK